MNNAELTARVAIRTSISKASGGGAVTAVFSTIANALASGETVTIIGFGTFSTKSRAGRQGRNPRTGEPIGIAAPTTPSFKPGKPLRDALD